MPRTAQKAPQARRQVAVHPRTVATIKRHTRLALAAIRSAERRVPESKAQAAATARAALGHCRWAIIEGLDFLHDTLEDPGHACHSCRALLAGADE